MAGYLEGSIGRTAEKLLREFHEETAQPPVKDIYTLTDFEQWLIIRLHNHETARGVGWDIAHPNAKNGLWQHPHIEGVVMDIAKPHFVVPVQQITNENVIYRRNDDGRPYDFPEWIWVIFENSPKTVFRRETVNHLLSFCPHYLFKTNLEANKHVNQCSTEK